MDQLKAGMRVLGVYHFWILTGLIALGTLGMGHMVQSGQAGGAASNYSKYEKLLKDMQSLSREGELPNQATVEGMNARIGARREEVVEAWTKVYERQVDILKWPKELQQDFIREVDHLRPIEETVKYPVEGAAQLRIGLRERYRDYIKAELPKLASIIGAKWNPGSANNTGPGAAVHEGAEGVGDGYVVYWEDSNQSAIETGHFDWSKTEDQAPNTLQVLYAQEDLWVLRAVMDVIKATNDGADAPHNAAIRRIYAIDLGQSASGSVELGSNSESEQTVRRQPIHAGRGTTQTVAPRLDVDPAEGRYVDDKDQPLTAEKLRSAAQSTSPEDAYLAVAKRMPVRLRVRMDHRKLNKLIAECANSNLTIVVRQIRLGSQGSRTEVVNNTIDNPFPYDVDVEVYGTIYIYNPISATRVGGDLQKETDGTATDGTATDGTATGDSKPAEGTTPAGTGAAPAGT